MNNLHNTFAKLIIAASGMVHHRKRHLYSDVSIIEADERHLLSAPFSVGPALPLFNDWALVHSTVAPAVINNRDTERTSFGARVKTGAEIFVGDHIAVTGEYDYGRFEDGVRRHKGSASLRLSTNRNNSRGVVWLVEPQAVFERTTELNKTEVMSTNDATTFTVNAGIAGAGI